MQSNVMIGIGALSAISLLLAPTLAIPIGNYYTNQLSNDEIDKVQAWRNARFFYRVSMHRAAQIARRLLGVTSA